RPECDGSGYVSAGDTMRRSFGIDDDGDGGDEFEEWISDVHSTGPPELSGFSRNLHRDWRAVHAGFTVHWSSGPVEDNISRLKLIQRQMFGRAKFDLLRKRVLLAG